MVALEDGHGPAGHHAGHHAGAAGGPGQEAGVGVGDCSAVLPLRLGENLIIFPSLRERKRVFGEIFSTCRF